MNKEKIASFLYLKFFFLIFVILCFGSVFYRIGYEVVSGKFRNNSFCLLYVASESKIICVDKNAKSALFLAVGDIRSIVKGKTPFEASFALGVPINGIVIDNRPPQNIAEFISTKNIYRLVFSSDSIFKNVNRFDIYKLSSILSDVPKDNKHEIRLNIFNREEFKSKIGDGFKDSIIINSPITIEIDNGTSINGLGNNLALILGRVGFNVISVKTVNQEKSSYIAGLNKDDIVIKSIYGLTNFPLVNTKDSQTADVTIFLGDDVDSMIGH